ncbi:LpqB family beta-propeller domain-containing protein [Brachybacterium sp. J153]|uniref:LpqB family beta-propeller domain-containing protein n=1 Tax=Brachybacterium sp. J153 TaxID=3116488 RepID=UPI002E76AE45|nr:LpqB family beta-propeller domain-containing protein [Brachybacterium sp. J153]MEE1616911.1 LpqB family beta-propeller domain-containing protein [Brachybacterium sp. J153]
MIPDRRDLLRAAGVLGVLGLGAACARIPTSSPIDSRPLEVQERPGAPYVQALPPPEDATPEEVVSGFVQAGVGSEDDFAVARKYLTPELAPVWDPSAAVTVYSGSQEIEVETLSETRLVLHLQTLSVVDQRGVRSHLASPLAREIEIGVELIEGQWRISDVPDGIHLSEAAFETLYSPTRLYFVDPRSAHLVPDHRWFAAQRGPAAILEGLRQGPVEMLRPAVRSEIPDSAEIALAEITTSPDGTLQVVVPAPITALPTARRALALAQMEASLRSMPALAEVQLLLAGRAVNDDEEARIERALPGHRPIAAGPRGVVALGEVEAGTDPVQLVPGLAGRTVSSPVIAPDGILVAALDTAGSTVLVASTDGSVPVRDAAAGGSFVPPRLDDAGYAWTSTRTNAGALLALSVPDARGDARIDAPWLAGREVRALDLAADATRLLVLSADAGGARVDLCAVVRGEDGAPSSLTEPVQLRTFLEDVTQASWYDEIAMILLGTDPSTGEQRALVVDFATGRDPLPSPRPGTDRLAGTVIAEAIWAGTDAGQLLRSDGQTWSEIPLEARDPSFY